MERLSIMLRALGHPVRLKLVELIRDGRGALCACEFENRFDLTQPTLSYHLKTLREAGLIVQSHDGPSNRLRVDEEKFGLLLGDLSRLCCDPQ